MSTRSVMQTETDSRRSIRNSTFKQSDPHDCHAAHATAWLSSLQCEHQSTLDEHLQHSVFSSRNKITLSIHLSVPEHDGTTASSSHRSCVHNTKSSLHLFLPVLVLQLRRADMPNDRNGPLRSSPSRTSQAGREELQKPGSHGTASVKCGDSVCRSFSEHVLSVRALTVMRINFKKTTNAFHSEACY